MPSDAIEPPFNSHTEDRWERFAKKGECEYCGFERLVMDEPFGHKPACKECWEQICYGE